jgi:hypothetical protein
MTKFDMCEKTGLSGLLFRNIRFWQFQSKAKEEAKFEDLKIQTVLKQEKGKKASRDQDRIKSSKKPKSQKPDHPVCQTGVSDFFRTNRVRVGFEI